MGRSPGRAAQRGFTYLALLALVAVTGYVSTHQLHQSLLMQRRQAERDLLDTGWRITQALESYAAVTPAGQDHRPRRLDDLLRDPRFPGRVVRHLRRIDVDPVTGQSAWGEVRSPDGNYLIGVYSLAEGRPMLQLLQRPFQDFSEAAAYRDWVFKAGLGED